MTVESSQVKGLGYIDIGLYLKQENRVLALNASEVIRTTHLAELSFKAASGKY